MTQRKGVIFLKPPGEQKRNSQEDQYDCCLRGSRPQAAGIDVAIEHTKGRAVPLPTAFLLENWCGNHQSRRNGQNTCLYKALELIGETLVRTQLSLKGVPAALTLHLPNFLLERLLAIRIHTSLQSRCRPFRKANIHHQLTGSDIYSTFTSPPKMYATLWQPLVMPGFL